MVDGSEPGALIAGRYRVERELGRGGMSVVLLAHDEVHERPVALKILRREMAGAVNAERFLRETRLLGRLQHPHILPMFDSGMIGDVPFFVMPFVEGETLRARMRRERQLAIGDAITIATDVLDAMQHAHEHDIVHRDIKPENILLSSGRAYVADFGIARAIHRAADEPATSAGLAVGTPAYMSPEQASAEHDLDGRSDLYSFGCVLFEMLAGIPPFVAATAQGTVSRRFVAPAPSVRELRDNVPDHVADAIAISLSRVPGDRFSSAAEMRRALVDRTESHASLPVVRTRATRRHTSKVAAGAALGVVMVLGLSRLMSGIVAPSVDELVTEGIAAIAGWEPETAQMRLDRALTRAPNDARAQLWMAQAAQLVSPSTDTTWRWAARRAAANPEALTEHERLRASALSALADGRHPEACELFDRLAAVAPGDPGALMGLGDCQAFDPVVLPDPQSASGWRFRGSYHTAAERYLRILERYPSAAGARPVVLGRLQRVLRTDPNRSLRFGRVEGSSAPAFGAQQALLHDTLGFVPYPVEQLDVGGSGMHAAGVTRIAERNRSVLRAVALSWTELAPRSAEAHEALAQALEATGEIDTRHVDAPSALEAVRRARRFSGDSAQLLRLGHQQTRLLLRAGQFAAARELADSLLASWTDPRPSQVDPLSSLAALTGRSEHVVRLLRSMAAEYDVRLADGRVYRPPPELGETALALQGYAAVGEPVDSILRAWQRLEAQLESYVSAAERDLVRDALAARALSLAVPVAGFGLVARVSGESNYLIRLQQMLGRGDRAGARRALAELERLRRDQPATAVSADATYLEAFALAAVGDTIGAARQLDRMLNALPALGAGFLEDAIGAGALVRAMLLRAEFGEHWRPDGGMMWRHTADSLRRRGNRGSSAADGSIRWSP